MRIVEVQRPDEHAVPPVRHKTPPVSAVQGKGPRTTIKQVQPEYRIWVDTASTLDSMSLHRASVIWTLEQ